MNDGAGLIGALRRVVGDGHVLVDADVRASYEVDWTGRYRGNSPAVVRPGSVDEVSAVVRRCAEFGAAIVTQGGNTGLVGGGVPRNSEIVLSTRRLDGVGPVDLAASQLTCGAGATIAAVQRQARDVGLDMAVDWGARDSATVGGAIATNAGGSRVVRFGTMRNQVAGIQAVLADGSIVDDLGGLPKSTMGLHLPSVMCGSEGTLAVITAARLRLVPCFQHRAAAWISVPSVQIAAGLLPCLRSLECLDAVELLLPEAVEIVAEQFGLRPPLNGGAVTVIVEVAAGHDPTVELAALLGECRGIDEAVIGVGAQHDHLISIRDHVSMAINRVGVPLKLDVAVPVGDLHQLVGHARETVARLAPHSSLFTFGHLAEGNVHLNVVGAGEQAAVITEEILGWVIERHGTVSAEHGVGVAKRAWLGRARGDGAVAVMRSIKDGLDPRGLFNPGVLI